MAAPTLFRSVTAQGTKWASPPDGAALARADAAAASPVLASISAMTTRAPSSANRSAVALPMPPPPPVMKATLPANRAIAELLASFDVAHDALMPTLSANASAAGWRRAERHSAGDADETALSRPRPIPASALGRCAFHRTKAALPPADNAYTPRSTL